MNINAYKHLESVSSFDEDDIENVGIIDAHEGIRLALLEFIEKLEELPNYAQIVATLRDEKNKLNKKNYKYTEEPE